MDEFGGRIGRVRMKNGGADIRLFPGEKRHDSESIHSSIRRHAARTSEMSEDGSELDGFVMMGLFSDGRATVSYKVPSRIPTSLLMSYLIERLRQDIIVSEEAADVFDRKFEWVE